MVPVHKPRCQKSSEKKLGWGDEIASQIYIYEITTCLFFLINCDMNSTCSTLLPNSAALRKNNNTTNTRCVYWGRFFHHDLARPGFFPLDMMAIFQSTGYLGFSVHWRENRNLPLRNDEVSEGAGCFFFRLMQIICFKLQVECFFCANWICVCVCFLCVLVFEIGITWKVCPKLRLKQIELLNHVYVLSCSASG